MIKCVLFDLDGVLVDACEWHYLSLNQAMREIVGYDIDREQHIAEFNGLTTRQKLTKLNIDSDRSEKIWKRKQELTIETIEENSQLDMSKRELLGYLKASDVKVVCVTNCIRETAEMMLRKTGQHEYFDLIVTNEDVENNKPAPDCYNHAVKLIDISATNCLIVEDSPKGLQSANASSVERIWKVAGPSEVNLTNYKRIENEGTNTNGRRGK